jgi:thermostable hemolysin
VQIITLPETHARRLEVERFIADVYRDHYSASVPHFPRDLIAMLDSDGKFVCASGLRFAETGFFSECYLDVPIEQALSNAIGKQVNRSGVFEVTGLASRAPRMATRFLRSVVAYGELAGFDWAFFTATHRLRELLNRIQLPPLALAVADPERVHNARMWGSYYASAPIVCAVGRGTASTFLARDAVEVVYA